MTTKLPIIEELGEHALLIPELVNRALEANDRVKFVMTLLQAAKHHADHPERPLVDLRSDRQRLGLDHSLDDVVRGSRLESAGSYRIPDAASLHRQIVDGIDCMIAPLRERDPTGDDVAALQARLEELTRSGPAPIDELVPERAIDVMTRARREFGDSLHLLVMDLHKALNRLQADLATETIDGSRTYGLRAEDRELVAAFMHGLNQTAHLKFDHPGLDCTATSSGGQLVIQNDIGTTDAHVLVVRVDSDAATIQYTDVHPARMRFFQYLCDARAEVSWKATRVGSPRGLGEGGEYIHAIGTHRWSDRVELARFLEHLGSRLVFLIDWNKARKRLREFVKKADAIRVLEWAADNDVGHRGFVQLGGARLVFDAIERAGNVHVRYGQKLDEVPGRDQAVVFLKTVLRTASRGLASGRSESLIRDEVRALLLECFHTVREDLLRLASDHAALIFELANGVQEGLLDSRSPDANDALARRARRGIQWERQADAVLNRTRQAVERTKTPANRVFRTILERADDAADNLEEALFLLTMVPAVGVTAGVPDFLDALGQLVKEGTSEFIKCVETASLVHRGGHREDMGAFLAAANRLFEIEHESDEIEREVTQRLMENESDARRVHLVARVATCLEGAVDALCLSAAVLREHVLDTGTTT